MKSAPMTSVNAREQTPWKAAFLKRYPIIAAIFVDCRPDIILKAAILALTLYVAIYAGLVATAKDTLTLDGAIIGGDFVVFWTAAKAVFSDNAAALYDSAVMNAQLLEAFPAREQFFLTWQYPPTMFFMIASFAALPYLPALWAWNLATAGAMGVVAGNFWRNRTALLTAFASAAAYQGWITGQTGFLTAALIALAAGWADRRPVLAGLAAGILTMKPQLGLLIPIAFAAAGCWRAFAVAALTGAGLALLSVLTFGAGVWIAFYEAVAVHGARMSADIFPYHKVISPFGGLMALGAPFNIAMTIQALTTLALAAFVFFIWRREKAWDLRLIALCASAPLATPYAFYYELPIFIIPLFLLAKRGVETGWLQGEKQALMALWIAPVLLPGNPHLPMAAIIASGAFALCARRCLEEGALNPRTPAMSE